MPLTQVPDPRLFGDVDYDDRDLTPTPPPGAVYRLPVLQVSTKTWWTDLKRNLTAHLVSTRTITIQANPELRLYSRVGETPDAFASRCATAAGERADAAIAALERKYETRLRTLRTRADSATTAAQRARAQHDAQHGAGAQVSTILGGIFGGRRSRSSIVAEAKRAVASQARVETAYERATAAEQAILDIEADLRAEVLALDAEWSAKASAIQDLVVPLEKSDVTVADLRLLWVPVP